jgi:predicted PurR-regulated permease PerM
MDRLGAWLNPGNILQVSIRGPSFVDMALKHAPKFLAILVIVHVLAFFLLLYGARLLKKLVDMIPGVSEKQNVVEIASEIEQTAARYFALLAVPLLATFKIFCDRIEPLRRVGSFLGRP